MMPDDQADQNAGDGPAHDLTHDFVVDESDPMDHEKTQLQRDDEYHTMSMSASQNMLASEWEDRPAIEANRAGIFTAHSVSSSGAKVQASSDFESEIRAREEKERKEKEWQERKKREEEERKLAQSDSHTF